MDLNGAGALISGGASGLGAATARLLVERGAHVALIDLDADKANALAGELGDAAHAVPCDVTDPGEMEAAVDEAATLLGGLRLAVGCAGIGWAERTVHKRGAHSFEPYEKVIQVNLI
ncbi:MAG TPA: SDR family NAD(P)-dependent oxidoreductase, partial [Thermoleophilaceae bacterium]|nr:SDR family NAD(P)-dependent oxidoreductase [Thermoleophilaceae bacterium]